MGHVTILFRATAKPGNADAVREALLAAVAPTRAEPGCISYELHVDEDNSSRFTSYELWASDEALQAHGQAPHVAALGALWALLEEGPSDAISRLTPLSQRT